MFNYIKYFYPVIFCLIMLGCSRQDSEEKIEFTVKKPLPDGDALLIEVKNNSNRLVCVARGELSFSDDQLLRAMDKNWEKYARDSTDKIKYLNGVDISEGVFIVGSGSRIFGSRLPDMPMPNNLKELKVKIHYNFCSDIFEKGIWKFISMKISKTSAAIDK